MTRAGNEGRERRPTTTPETGGRKPPGKEKPDATLKRGPTPFGGKTSPGGNKLLSLRNKHDAKTSKKKRKLTTAALPIKKGKENLISSKPTPEKGTSPTPPLKRKRRFSTANTGNFKRTKGIAPNGGNVEALG